MFSLKVSSGRKSDKSEANTNFKANLKLGMYLLFKHENRDQFHNFFPYQHDLPNPSILEFL